MLLQTALAAETHLADGLTLKLRCTVKLELSLTDLVGMHRLTVSKTNEPLILQMAVFWVVAPCKRTILRADRRCGHGFATIPCHRRLLHGAL
jgi:hypothetical protein